MSYRRNSGSGSGISLAFTAAVLGIAMSVPLWGTDVDGATRTVENAGYTATDVGGYGWFACGKGDLWKTNFEAVNQNGQDISGTVCAGLFKGSTIRFD